MHTCCPARPRPALKALPGAQASPSLAAAVAALRRPRATRGTPAETGTTMRRPGSTACLRAGPTGPGSRCSCATARTPTWSCWVRTLVAPDPWRAAMAATAKHHAAQRGRRRLCA